MQMESTEQVHGFIISATVKIIFIFLRLQQIKGCNKFAFSITLWDLLSCQLIYFAFFIL